MIKLAILGVVDAVNIWGFDGKTGHGALAGDQSTFVVVLLIS